MRRSFFEEGSVHREDWVVFPWLLDGMEAEETAAVASEDLNSVGIVGKRS